MWMRASLLALALLLAGCENPRGREAGARGERAGEIPAAAQAADWCAGHQVPESQCTLCNPALIPAFKARGDWCAEHGLPESICPACQPEPVAPPADVAAPAGATLAADGAPADGTRIRFRTPEAAREAGLETVPATASADAASVLATAVLVADASRTAVVNVRAPGVVRELTAVVGTRVTRGATMALIESAEVAADASGLAAARARALVAENAYRREQAMHEKGISSHRAVEKAEEEWTSARAEVEALGAALALVGASVESRGRYAVRAPISGVVTRLSAVLGKLVDPEETLFEIIDPTVLWAEIDVPEADAAYVAPGQRVAIEVGAGPAPTGGGRRVEARLSSVAPVIDPATRTARARARIDNGGGLLRANSYARARIFVVPDSAAVLVPRAALQVVKGASFVFVRVAADEFETRRVAARPAAGDPDLAVAVGVKPGEDVVTVGSFLLKTETLKESIGVGCCDVKPPARQGG